LISATDWLNIFYRHKWLLWHALPFGLAFLSILKITIYYEVLVGVPSAFHGQLRRCAAAVARFARPESCLKLGLQAAPGTKKATLRRVAFLDISKKAKSLQLG
jgi:hypothetical protein